MKQVGLLKKSKIKDTRPMATEASSEQAAERQREEDAEFRLFQQPQVVAILGASSNPDRYAYKAFQMLKEFGHSIIAVNPKLILLDGIQTTPSLKDIKEHVQTVTVYVSASISTGLKEDLINLQPDRIIFNPGSENAPLQLDLKNAGIEVIEACTLVLLKTEQF